MNVSQRNYYLLYFCQTDSLGNLLDLRDKTNCPCLANFAKKSSSELQRLVTTAIDNQMKALVEAEGKNSSLLISLRSELTDVSRSLQPKSLLA